MVVTLKAREGATMKPYEVHLQSSNAGACTGARTGEMRRGTPEHSAEFCSR